MRRFTATHLQLGQMGVTVFFLCSGFIIPVSLERHGSLKTFWVSRFSRLYPMYWVSVIAAYVLWQAGRWAVDPELAAHPVRTFIANLTMVSKAFGSPFAIDLYWTLTVELLFYVMCSVIFYLGWQRLAVLWAVLAIAGAAGAAALPQVVLDKPGTTLIYPFAAMFTGTVLHRWTRGQVPGRTASLVVALAAAGIVLGLAPRIHHPLHKLVGTGRFQPMVVAYLLAYALFVVMLLTRSRPIPRAITYIGTISYSIYLIHPLMLSLLPRNLRGPSYVLIGVAITIAASAVTYRLIEAPTITLGRRVAERLAEKEKSSGRVRGA